jgi:hypothetical protein
MIFDKQLMFAENLLIGINVGTTKSQTIDLYGGFGTVPQTGPSGVLGELGGPRIFDLARGKALSFFAQMTVTMASGGAATTQCLVYGCATIDGSNDLAATTITYFDSGALSLATVVAGYRFKFGRFQPNTLLRYMQCYFVIGAANATLGKVTAGLTFDDMIPNAQLT